MPIVHRERRRTQHIGWLRVAVLGANDGIVSTASLGVYSGKLQVPYDAFAAGLGDYRIITTLCPAAKNGCEG